MLNDPNPAFTRFADDLDNLIDKYRDNPQDDRLSHAEVVGALYFAAHNLMVEAQRIHNDADDEGSENDP